MAVQKRSARVVNIGLLGSGFIAELYLRALRHVPDARVVINYSRRLARARGLARRHGIPRSTDKMEDVIRDPEVDLAMILLPNFFHKSAALALARAGKAMICEKPLARNHQEARAMLAAVEDAGVFHGYAESEVFMPAVMRASEMVRAGGIGKVLAVRSHGAHYGPHADWFWDKKLAGGGALLDMGCHSISAARCFFGKENLPTEVFAWGGALVHGRKTRAEDTASALLRFQSGGIAQIHVSWAARGGLDMRNEVFGTHGAVFTDITRGAPLKSYSLRGAGYTVEKAETDKGWQFPVPEEHISFGYVNELRHFIDCFRGGRPPRETFADGVVVNRIMDAAYRAMRDGRWQRLGRRS